MVYLELEIQIQLVPHQIGFDHKGQLDLDRDLNAHHLEDLHSDQDPLRTVESSVKDEGKEKHDRKDKYNIMYLGKNSNIQGEWLIDIYFILLIFILLSIFPFYLTITNFRNEFMMFILDYLKSQD